MYPFIKKLSFISLALIGGTVTAQMSRYELLEHLQVDEHTPILELNVGQLITLVQNVPVSTQVCENFSGHSYGAQFTANSTLTVGGVDFRMDYTGGGRIAEFPGFNQVRFLEMVEDGALVITLPVDSNDVFVSMIQAAPDPNEIEYYDANGQSLGMVYTSFYNQLDSIHLPATGIRTIVIRNPEPLIESVCYSL